MRVGVRSRVRVRVGWEWRGEGERGGGLAPVPVLSRDRWSAFTLISWSVSTKRTTHLHRRKTVKDNTEAQTNDLYRYKGINESEFKVEDNTTDTRPNDKTRKTGPKIYTRRTYILYIIYIYICNVHDIYSGYDTDIADKTSRRWQIAPVLSRLGGLQDDRILSIQMCRCAQARENHTLP